jgi:hypothetical protein
VSEAFRIAWTRSGGVAGITRTVTVASEDLPEAERAAVAALLDRVVDGPPTRGADRFVHELEITRGATTRRITVREGAVPGPVADLLARLRARA